MSCGIIITVGLGDSYFYHYFFVEVMQMSFYDHDVGTMTRLGNVRLDN